MKPYYTAAQKKDTVPMVTDGSFEVWAKEEKY